MNNASESVSKTRVRIETVIAAIAGILAIVTLFSREWIEALTGWDPDGGNGALEWLIVLVLAVVAIGVGYVARRDWRVFKAQGQRV